MSVRLCLVHSKPNTDGIFKVILEKSRTHYFEIIKGSVFTEAGRRDYPVQGDRKPFLVPLFVICTHRVNFSVVLWYNSRRRVNSVRRKQQPWPYPHPGACLSAFLVCLACQCALAVFVKSNQTEDHIPPPVITLAMLASSLQRLLHRIPL